VGVEDKLGQDSQTQILADSKAKVPSVFRGLIHATLGRIYTRSFNRIMDRDEFLIRLDVVIRILGGDLEQLF
jgi:hypothetical protein